MQERRWQFGNAYSYNIDLKMKHIYSVHENDWTDKCIRSPAQRKPYSMSIDKNEKTKISNLFSKNGNATTKTIRDYKVKESPLGATKP